MTTDELERDLELLTGPREADERLHLAIRARLGEQMTARPRRRLLPRAGFGWAAAAAAAIVAACVAVGLPGGGSSGPSPADAAIIRHALVAITSPANVIVHVREVGVQDGTQVAVEWWQQTSPPHALRMLKGPVGGEREGAGDGTTSFVYDAGTHTITATPSSAAPTLVDPMTGVREQLARGRAQVAGKATIDGTTFYRIELPTGVVGYFDTRDYRPVYLDNPQRGGSVVRTRVVTYQELPPTPANEKLLSITAQHPDARVRTQAAPVK
jgi:hypothetical protein